MKSTRGDYQPYWKIGTGRSSHRHGERETYLMNDAEDRRVSHYGSSSRYRRSAPQRAAAPVGIFNQPRADLRHHGSDRRCRGVAGGGVWDTVVGGLAASMGSASRVSNGSPASCSTALPIMSTSAGDERRQTTDSSTAAVNGHHPPNAELYPSERASKDKGRFRYAPAPLLPEYSNNVHVQLLAWFYSATVA